MKKRQKGIPPLVLHPRSSPKRSAIVLPSIAPRSFPVSTRPYFPDPLKFDHPSDISHPPILPTEAITNYSRNLTPKEQTEILSFPHIYFIRLCQKPNEPDEDPDFYPFIMDNHILFRFQQISVLGQGSFGIAIKCFDHKTKKFVAIKIIKDNRIIHPQLKMEIEALQAISYKDPENQENVVHMMEFNTYRSYFFLICELLYGDMYSALRNDGFRGFHKNILTSVCRQVVSAIAFTHSIGIIHCDIKPENILWANTRKTQVKLIDFGSSCRSGFTLFKYVQSRFYRAPEVILELPYTQSIDIWSLGCLMAELMMGNPVFPGQSEIEQLAFYHAVLGPPPPEYIAASPKKDRFYDGMTLKAPIPKQNEILCDVKSADPLFHSIVMCCLKWRPEDRIRAKDILRNPWFRPLGPRTL